MRYEIGRLCEWRDVVPGTWPRCKVLAWDKVLAIVDKNEECRQGMEEGAEP